MALSCELTDLWRDEGLLDKYRLDLQIVSVIIVHSRCDQQYCRIIYILIFGSGVAWRGCHVCRRIGRGCCG